MRRVLVLLAALWCAGCAPLGVASSGSHATSGTPDAPADAVTTNEVSSAPPPTEHVSEAALAPASAVRAFANAYINWNAATVASQMRALAAQSVGQARSAMQLAAAQTGSDYELRSGGIANSGTVEAVAAFAGQRDQYVVVTREQTTATATSAYEGLQPAWHVTLATVAQTSGGGWVISGWQPES